MTKAKINMIELTHMVQEIKTRESTMFDNCATSDGDEFFTTPPESINSSLKSSLIIPESIQTTNDSTDNLDIMQTPLKLVTMLKSMVTSILTQNPEDQQLHKDEVTQPTLTVEYPKVDSSLDSWYVANDDASPNTDQTHLSQANTVSEIITNSSSGFEVLASTASDSISTQVGDISDQEIAGVVQNETLQTHLHDITEKLSDAQNTVEKLCFDTKDVQETRHKETECNTKDGAMIDKNALPANRRSKPVSYTHLTLPTKA